jgi:hypothetical protein
MRHYSDTGAIFDLGNPGTIFLVFCVWRRQFLCPAGGLPNAPEQVSRSGKTASKELVLITPPAASEQGEKQESFY